MNYGKPELHRLGGMGSAEGNCGNGTGATSPPLTCLAGSGDDGSGICDAGTGAGYYCKNGTGATDNGSDYCTPGTSPTTSCTTGTAPEF